VSFCRIRIVAQIVKRVRIRLIESQHHAVVYLSGVGDPARDAVICAVSDGMGVMGAMNDGFRIAGGVAIIAFARVAGPSRALRDRFRGAHGGNGRGARCQQSSIQETARGDDFFEAEDFVEAGGLGHRFSSERRENSDYIYGADGPGVVLGAEYGVTASSAQPRAGCSVHHGSKRLKGHHEKTSILLLFCDPRRRLHDGERADEACRRSRGA